MNNDIVWSKLLKIIKDKVSSLTYETNFEETELYKLENNKAYIIFFINENNKKQKI